MKLGGEFRSTLGTTLSQGQIRKSNSDIIAKIDVRHHPRLITGFKYQSSGDKMLKIGLKKDV